MSKAAEVKKQVAGNINQHKSRLMDELRKLENTPGCSTAARQLESIIGRLEGWQTKHSN